jgi:RNA-directed DNA polymerase
MLTALEMGVKGGRWYSLMDKVYTLPNLRAAFVQVRANHGAAGVDHQTIAMFEHHLEANLVRVAAELRAGTYRPRAVRRHWIPKPGKRNEKRPLGIPTVRDRVVQAALCNVIEPIYERDFAEHSYGFRPGRSCRDALRRVVALLEGGYTQVVDADLKSYFDTIPQEQLLERVRTKVSDGRVLQLIDAFLKQGVLDEGKHWIPEQGTPQGGVLSPLLSNIYLDALDHHMARLGYQMVRYADDFVILGRSEAEAQAALREVEQWTRAAGLQLHPEKTRIVDYTQPGGFDFLGYHFERGYRWPRQKSLVKLKQTMRQQTPRTSGHSLSMIIANVNRTLVGWFEYFQHSHPTTFAPIDQWIRMRLRSILRKRSGRRGRGRGRDHQRWPNAYLAKHGLYSLTTAFAQARQSSRR